MSRQLIFLVEGKSEEALINTLAPRLLPPDCTHRIITFHGKQELEKQFIRRIKAFTNKASSNYDIRFLILRDQDAGECIKIKENLLQKMIEANIPQSFKIRIACHTIESWYLAQLDVVSSILEMILLLKNKTKEITENQIN